MADWSNIVPGIVLEFANLKTKPIFVHIKIRKIRICAGITVLNVHLKIVFCPALD